MSKAAGKKTTNDRLKEKLAEKEKEMEELRKEMEEKSRAFEARLAETLNMKSTEIPQLEEVYVSGEVGTVSDVSSKSQSMLLIEQMGLVAGRKANCNIFVTQELFPEIKIIDDDTFKDNPKILEGAMNKMNVVTDRERMQLSEATKRAIKYSLCHRRSYCKLRHADKYKGK